MYAPWFLRGPAAAPTVTCSVVPADWLAPSRSSPSPSWDGSHSSSLHSGPALREPKLRQGCFHSQCRFGELPTLLNMTLSHWFSLPHSIPQNEQVGIYTPSPVEGHSCGLLWFPMTNSTAVSLPSCLLTAPWFPPGSLTPGHIPPRMALYLFGVHVSLRKGEPQKAEEGREEGS